MWREDDINDLKEEIKELRKIQEKTESDAEWDALEDEIFEKEIELNRLEEDFEYYLENSDGKTDDDYGIAEYGLYKEEMENGR